MTNESDASGKGKGTTEGKPDTKVDERGKAESKAGKGASEGKGEARSESKAEGKSEAAKPKSSDGPPALDERRLSLAEWLPHVAQLDADALIEAARDGRAVVRGNAALGLAALGQIALEHVTMLRDSDAHVAASAAEAIAHLGDRIRPRLTAIVQALDSTQPDVTASVLKTLAGLIGKLDDELVLALDVPYELAQRTVVEAARAVGRSGLAFLIRAAQHERSRIRVNAIGGIGTLGKIDEARSLEFLASVESGDPVPDVRRAAKQASLQVIARGKIQGVDRLPKTIPDFEARKLSSSELRESEGEIRIDEMIEALRDGRAHVKINAARALAIKAEKSAPAAAAMGVLLRDSVTAVRVEVATALGKMGVGALDAAADLVGALGDAEDDVAAAAMEALSTIGEPAREALIKGLDAGTEAHGLRVGELIGRLPRAAETLTDALASPAVNMQVNAALGLGLLGPRKVGAGLAALHARRTGGDARTREAVRRALDSIEPRGPRGPRAVPIDGFEDRFLDAKDVDKAKAQAEAVGVDDLVGHLTDGRDVVRANAALALGALGAPASPAAASLGVRMRDDAARVRVAAIEAVDRIGDAAVVATAADLVGVLRDSDDKVATAAAAVLRARKGRVVAALVAGLETDDPRHGRRICAVIATLPDASDILCDAFESPAVNVQVNAALGLGALGPDRVGKGRRKLEGARTGGDARTREAVRRALDVLDGPRDVGPRAVDVAGFETQLLDAAAFGDGQKLRADDLIAHLQDGRATVRANAATALGSLGAAAAPAATGLGVLLRDDSSDVRIAAARALDKLGDDAVREVASFLVGALRGDAAVAKEVAPVLAARKARVLAALIKGLETDDEAHARRILELVNALPDACEILCDAFESPAENVQVNAAIGIGMLGAKRAGAAGRKKLEGGRTGGFARTREAVFKALAMLA